MRVPLVGRNLSRNSSGSQTADRDDTIQGVQLDHLLSRARRNGSFGRQLSIVSQADQRHPRRARSCRLWDGRGILASRADYWSFAAYRSLDWRDLCVVSHPFSAHTELTSITLSVSGFRPSVGTRRPGDSGDQHRDMHSGMLRCG